MYDTIKGATNPTVTPIMFTVAPIGKDHRWTADRQSWIEEINTWIKDVLVTDGTPVFDTYALLLDPATVGAQPAMLEQYAAKPNPPQGEDNDWLHWNSDGRDFLQAQMVTDLFTTQAMVGPTLLGGNSETFNYTVAEPATTELSFNIVFRKLEAWQDKANINVFSIESDDGTNYVRGYLNYQFFYIETNYTGNVETPFTFRIAESVDPRAYVNTEISIRFIIRNGLCSAFEEHYANQVNGQTDVSLADGGLWSANPLTTIHLAKAADSPLQKSVRRIRYQNAAVSSTVLESWTTYSDLGSS